MGVWIAIDDSKIENGCLWFIPGSHKSIFMIFKFLHNNLDHDLNYRFVRTNSENPPEPLLKYIGYKPVYDSDKFIPVPVPRG